MTSCLDFQNANCKNCYKCLRSCPVKAIAVTNHQARIIDERCILCGTCTHVCPQNAKHVHSDKDEVYTMLSSGEKIIASVAPSFISSFGIRDFSLMKIALGKLGFFDSAETSVGANLVVKKYNELLLEKEYKNFITSACPAVNTLIQLYYPKALPYLAPVDSPMLAHTKILKSQNKDAKIVFIGPCIAKKKEAQQSGIIDATLTFEDLAEMLEEEGIIFDDIAKLSIEKPSIEINKAKFFPISSGIIKSFNILPSGYEYVAIDGVQKCMEILENIESLSGMFLELNACDYSCVNGPCSLTKKGSAIKANSDIRNYVNLDLIHTIYSPKLEPSVVDITTIYPRIKTNSMPVSEKRTNEILAMTGKLKPSDELNCGACGYSSCREKAWAVANGYAELEMCLPYMRERAETMAYEILQNSPNGIVVLDSDLKLIEINAKAIKIYGVDGTNYKGRDFVDFENPTDFVLAQLENKNLIRKKIYISKTKTYVEMTIIILKEHNILFGFLTDITEEVSYNEKLSKVRSDTIATTDEVIKKQMRVAQEIASLLGETTAETKVALLKLKKVLSEAEKKGE
ncbi:MAG: [Fe-Fe] hydrogenase large subunit C-terminal domain-containing protein [Clostridia bacterium]|nr:[Fe-Fe] hydrogenase large subunit C-terminal domain-containing protein [Clostridia bacterium]